MTTRSELRRSGIRPLAALTTLLFTLALIAVLAACKKSQAPQPTAQQTGGTGEERVERNPDRNAYFGEEHIHTSWSLDAWVMGNRITGPDDALKYAQGQTIKHPMGYDIKIDTPNGLHGGNGPLRICRRHEASEYSGFLRQQVTGGAAIDHEGPKQRRGATEVFLYLLSLTSKPPIKAFMAPEVAVPVWKENVKIAEENNHPGKFTAFCSYEWTSMPNNRNLHRNIFFRDCTHLPEMPFQFDGRQSPRGAVELDGLAAQSGQ